MNKKTYNQVFDELSVDDSGTIIIPPKFQPKAVQMAHEGYQGNVKTKQLLRSTIGAPYGFQTSMQQ